MLLMDTYAKHTSADVHGPWDRATSVKVQDNVEVLTILEWCMHNLESQDWAYQRRNNFANSELIFYFNNLRDYTFFLLKYQR